MNDDQQCGFHSVPPSIVLANEKKSKSIEIELRSAIKIQMLKSYEELGQFPIKCQMLDNFENKSTIKKEVVALHRSENSPIPSNKHNPVSMSENSKSRKGGPIIIYTDGWEYRINKPKAKKEIPAWH